MNNDLAVVLLGNGIAIAGAIVFAVLLRHFERQDGRTYLRFWTWSWLAFVVYTIGAVSGRLLSPVQPPTSPLRITLSVLSLAAGYLQLAWLLFGTHEFLTRRPLASTRLVPSFALALVAGLVLTALWIDDPGAVERRYFVRVGLRVLIACGSFIAAAIWMTLHGARRVGIGGRLLPLALLFYGIDQALFFHWALPIPRPLLPTDAGFRTAFAPVEIFLQLLIGLGMLLWMLEIERQQRLVNVAERRRMEEQLRQSQKMEAVGRLAGGIAHDFNNLLTAMGGYADLSLAKLEPGHPVYSNLEEIHRAARRAAGLTRQLLSFSRQQAMQLQRLDLNDAVAEQGVLLERLIREDVTLDFSLTDEPIVVDADFSMITQVLVNLCVNARDAMPSGGQLTIETSLVELDEQAASRHPQARPGTFACLCVADTGFGIAPEHLPRIFDPFFTTKDVGQGTGLGLSTTYGVVQQHGGWIEVETVVGEGTTFRVFLPRASGPAPRHVESEPTRSPGGRETLLLVEDEVHLRTLMHEALSGYGYTVIDAGSGPDALAAWEACGSGIDLLVSDIVMPDGMSGLDLAARLRQVNPTLKVILMSGYHEESGGDDLRGVVFLTKPFSVHDLATHVRRFLDLPPVVSDSAASC